MNPQIEVITNRRFYLTVEDQNGCVSREQYVYVRATRKKMAMTDSIEYDFDNVYTENLISSIVYPNPATDYVTVDHAFHEKTDVKLSITNLIGRTFFEVAGLNNNTYSFNIKVADFQQGVYDIKIETGDGAFYKRFIRQ